MMEIHKRSDLKVKMKEHKSSKNYLKQLFVIRFRKDQNCHCFKSALFSKSVITTILLKRFLKTR